MEELGLVRRAVGQRLERPVRSPAAVAQQDLDVGVEVQELCLDGHSKGAQIEHLAVDRSGDPEVLCRPATSAPLLIHCHPNPAPRTRSPQPASGPDRFSDLVHSDG